MTRYFHLYADGKRIREISLWEYIEIGRKSRGSKYRKTTMWVGKNDIGIGRGNSHVWVSIKQLLEVLKVCGVIKDEG